jgi:hypothetical protein
MNNEVVGAILLRQYRNNEFNPDELSDDWTVYCAANAVSAHKGDNLDTEVPITVQTVGVYNLEWPNPPKKLEVKYNVFTRYPKHLCGYCGGEISNRECTVCGAS